MRIGLSHFELKVRDMARMEDFYTRVLDFVVTDRNPPNAHPMVFLSADPGEHHQIVLTGAGDGEFRAGSLDHLAFRVDGLGALRQKHALLGNDLDRSVETVSHGTTWSIYFRDPEGNRLELFADTPWYV
ncbi:MAG: VOC family protein, partial [Alphaproteobacteria bacterium]